MFSSKNYHIGERINDNQIYGKLTFSSDLSPLYQWDQKNIRNLMCSSRTILLRSLQVFSHRKPAAWQTKPHTRNPCRCALLFSQSFASQASPHAVQYTSVGLDTKRTALFDHSVLVISLSHTSFAALVCLRGLLCVGSRIVIPNLGPRSRWCRLFLIVHLDSPRVGIVIRVLITWPLRVVAFSFSLCLFVHLHAWVRLVFFF